MWELKSIAAPGRKAARYPEACTKRELDDIANRLLLFAGEASHIHLAEIRVNVSAFANNTEPGDHRQTARR
jgi:hypothetical protein